MINETEAIGQAQARLFDRVRQNPRLGAIQFTLHTPPAPAPGQRWWPQQVVMWGPAPWGVRMVIDAEDVTYDPA
jgi:hypothetical protein